MSTTYTLEITKYDRDFGTDTRTYTYATRAQAQAHLDRLNASDDDSYGEDPVSYHAHIYPTNA